MLHVSDSPSPCPVGHQNETALCVAGRAAPEPFAYLQYGDACEEGVDVRGPRTRSFEFANLSIGILHISSHTLQLRERTRSSWSPRQGPSAVPCPLWVRPWYLWATANDVFLFVLVTLEGLCIYLYTHVGIRTLQPSSSVEGSVGCVELASCSTPLLWLDKPASWKNVVVANTVLAGLLVSRVTTADYNFTR